MARLGLVLVLMSSVVSHAWATAAATSAPELDPGAARGALTLLAAAALVVVDRLRRPKR